MNQSIIGALCLSLAASIWGGMFVVSKYVLAFIPPITLVWLRYVIAFLVLYTFLKLKRTKDSSKLNIQTKDWRLLVWIGFVGYSLSISLQFIGTKLSDAHTAALITSSTPVFIVLFAKLILHEPFDVRKLISIFIATVRVVFIKCVLNTRDFSYEMKERFCRNPLVGLLGETWNNIPVQIAH
jgi:drug/metabolite transporter (DMT)-like permease